MYVRARAGAAAACGDHGSVPAMSAALATMSAPTPCDAGALVIRSRNRRRKLFRAARISRFKEYRTASCIGD
jgi:hypothetical protein